jgi:hypothetical protein
MSQVSRHRSVLVLGRGGSRDRHGRHAFGDQNYEVEHAEANRDHEKPSIHFAGNPVEADKVLFHRDLMLDALGQRWTPSCCNATCISVKFRIL